MSFDMVPNQPEIEVEVYRQTLSGRRLELFDKITSRIEVRPETGCWIWLGGDSGNGRGGGYGRIRVSGDMMAVHRVMWMLIHGPISSRRQVDHTCRNRACCNPAHLQDVTHKQNQRRRDAARSQVEAPDV